MSHFSLPPHKRSVFRWIATPKGIYIDGSADSVLTNSFLDVLYDVGSDRLIGEDGIPFISNKTTIVIDVRNIYPTRNLILNDRHRPALQELITITVRSMA